MVQRQTTLSANVVAFCRFLRNEGFTIGPSEEQDALLALHILEAFHSPEDLELCLQTALCRSPLQLEKFPELYRRYWKELERAVDSKIKEEPEEQTKNSRQQAPSIHALKSWLYGNRQEDETATAGYSPGETLGGQGIPALEDQDLKEVFKLVKKLAEKIANRRSRRYRKSHRKDQIDISRTLRKNVTRYGEMLELVYRHKKKDQISVVLLCDMSRSMELYSRFLIQFMFAFQQQFAKVSTFVFSTSLHQVSTELSASSLNASMDKIINKVNNWSGGTKIGASLAQFNQGYGHRLLHGKSLVIILSDGWDTGEAQLIEESMRHIHRRALQVVWLNPLAGHPDWQPEVQGMLAALPYIDALLPFHNLESLKQLVKKIKV